MAGYSKRTLVDKLGIKPGMEMAIINAPDGYDKIIGKLPLNTKVATSAFGTEDFIHIFLIDKSNMEKSIPALRRNLKSNGMLWVSWPKGKQKSPDALNENMIREVALKNKLVDVKVCAVDDYWSGLKLVIPLSERNST